MENIPVFRGCTFNCAHCTLKDTLKRVPCQQCKDFVPHSHMEALDRKPPKVKYEQHITMGLPSDISFMDRDEFALVLDYCDKYNNRTFLLQSKNPGYFIPFDIPTNVIVGTSIESNFDYKISTAPKPIQRYKAMLLLASRKFVSINPIMDFAPSTLIKWLSDIKPEFVVVGSTWTNAPTQKKIDKLVGQLSKFTVVRRI